MFCGRVHDQNSQIGKEQKVCKKHENRRFLGLVTYSGKLIDLAMLAWTRNFHYSCSVFFVDKEQMGCKICDRVQYSSLTNFFLWSVKMPTERNLSILLALGIFLGLVIGDIGALP
jgi:hypothetical protein